MAESTGPMPNPTAFGTETKLPIYSDLSSAAKNWSDGNLRLGDFSSGLDLGLGVLNTALDPLGAILGSAVDYLMNLLINHIKPLGDAVNYLLGDPPSITTTAQSWHDAGEKIAESANRHVGYLSDTPSWTGPAADAYKSVVSGTHEVYIEASGAAKSVAAWIGVAGGIVAAFRTFLWDMLKDFITQVIEAALLALAAAIPSFGSSIGAFSAWFTGKAAMMAGKFSKTLSKLMTKIGDLARKLGRSGRQFDVAAAKLSQTANKLGRSASGRFGRSGIGPEPRLPGSTKEEFDRNLPGYQNFNKGYKWAKRGSDAVDQGANSYQGDGKDAPIQNLPAGY